MRTWTCAALVLTQGACGDDERRLAPPRDAGPSDASAGDDSGPSALSCGGTPCTSSPAGTPSCCTMEGAGTLGHALENTGRAADLCGTDLGAVVEGLTGLCLQLAQPGEIDPSCPAQVVPDQFATEGTAPMTGCCSDEGYCGSLEVVFPLGCIYATGRKGKRCGDRTSDDGGAID